MKKREDKNLQPFVAQFLAYRANFSSTFGPKNKLDNDEFNVLLGGAWFGEKPITFKLPPGKKFITIKKVKVMISKELRDFPLEKQRLFFSLNKEEELEDHTTFVTPCTFLCTVKESFSRQGHATPYNMKHVLGSLYDTPRSRRGYTNVNELRKFNRLEPGYAHVSELGEIGKSIINPSQSLSCLNRKKNRSLS